jgi:hypothetical protein
MTELETLYKEHGDLRDELTRLKAQVQSTEAELYQEQKKCKVLEIQIQEYGRSRVTMHDFYGRPRVIMHDPKKPLPEWDISSIELLPSEPSGELRAMAQHIRDLEMLLGLLPKGGDPVGKTI